MIRKLLEKFRAMKREGLILWFIIGLYLLYTASSVVRGLEEESNRAWFCVFIVVFAILGIFLVLTCGYHLLRLFYLNIYEEQQEAEKARLEAGGQLPEQPAKKKTGTEKYLEFMFRLFKIKE